MAERFLPSGKKLKSILLLFFPSKLLMDLTHLIKEGIDLTELTESSSATSSIHLDLGYLHLGYNSIGDKLMVDIIKALVNFTKLTTLDLQLNDIKSAGGLAIANLLSLNSSITSLDLEQNDIEKQSAIEIAKILNKSSLTYLNLGYNYIGDVAATEFATALESNTKLISLDLSSNSITDDGAISFSEMIKYNSTLTSLSLAHNKIRDVGCYSLLEPLRINTSLTLLNLVGNGIDEQIIKKIDSALLVNIYIKNERRK